MLDELSVEGTTRANAGTNQDGSATSGGGPSGIVGYTARISPSATKTNNPLIETPQSVTVISREQLNDRGVQTLNELISYAPGTSTETFGYNPALTRFTFEASSPRSTASTATACAASRRRGGAAYRAYGAEAVTILRGPSAGLYGLGSPGGIVDVTSKRPVFTRFGEVVSKRGALTGFRAISMSRARSRDRDSTLTYRLTGIVRQSDSFLPGATDDRVNLAPSFTWKPSADTTFTLLTEFQRSRLPQRLLLQFSRVRRSRLYGGDPDFNRFLQEQSRIGYAFEHRFSPTSSSGRNSVTRIRIAITAIRRFQVSKGFKPIGTPCWRSIG